MAALASVKPLPHSPSLSPFLPNSIPIPLKYPPLLSSPPSRTRNPPLLAVPSSSPDPATSNYGGWDDLDLVVALGEPGKTNPIRSFLVSAGVRDGKHGALFLLGFLSALAVSRARVLPLAALPVSVLVFVAGFAAGMAKDGGGSDSADCRSCDGKVRGLGDILGELDVNMAELGDGLKGMVGLDQSESTKIRNFVAAVDLIKLKLGDAWKALEATDLEGNMVVGHQGVRKSNQKASRKRSAVGTVASDLVKYFGALIQENLAELRLPQRKGTGIQEEVGKRINSTEEEEISASNSSITKEKPAVNDRNSSPPPTESLKIPRAEQSGALPIKIDENATDYLKNGTVDIARGGLNQKPSLNFRDGTQANDMFSYDEEINELNANLQLVAKQGTVERTIFKHKSEEKLQNGTKETTRHTEFMEESEKSSLLEQSLQVGNRSYKLKIEQTGGVFFNEAKVRPEDPYAENPTHSNQTEEGNISSSSAALNENEFLQNMKKATELLRRARECMASKADEETADNLLYKSARFLSTAVALKPTSLLAVGQLGNAYLLHGELKLKISRELRTLLSHSDGYSNGKGRSLRFKMVDGRTICRENITSVLVDVCEECEYLLIEAGRKYRMALTIDEDDVKALYNWGLALSYRAQLIADIGPEAALDADKVYLAAIDKFDAMLSRNNAYAPEALYRWGIALHKRSRLRPRRNKERIKLLQQAKSLFEDVLYIKADNHIVREALSSCISELNYDGRWI